MTTRRRIVRDANGSRLIITRQRLVDFEDYGNYSMKLKDFRKAYTHSEYGGQVFIKNRISKSEFEVTFGTWFNGGGFIGCHQFNKNAFNRILKAAGIKPKAALAAAGR